jgi:hypothetical protein
VLIKRFLLVNSLDFLPYHKYSCEAFCCVDFVPTSHVSLTEISFFFFLISNKKFIKKRQIFTRGLYKEYIPNYTLREQRLRKSKKLSQGKQPETPAHSNKVFRKLFFRLNRVCSTPSKLRIFLSLQIHHIKQ